MAIPAKVRVNRMLLALVGGVLSVLLVLPAWRLGWLDSWEGRTFDWRARLMAEPGSATSEIALVLADQKSLDWGKEVNEWPWPWPREVTGAMIRYIDRCRPKAVVVDVLFTEHSRYGVDDDAALGSAFSEAGASVAAMVLGESTGADTAWPALLGDKGITVAGLDAWPHRKVAVYPRALFPIPEVASAADLLGNVTLAPDPDGIYRRASFFSLFDDRSVPAMALAAFSAASPDAAFSVSDAALHAGDRRIPLDGRGRAILRFRGPAGTHVRYSAAAVIQSEIRVMEGEPPVIPAEAFAGKFVFIGLSAPGLYDLRPSPMKGAYPGVEIHATQLDNLLSDDFLEDFPALAATLMVMVLTTAAACGLLYATRTLMTAGVGLLALAIPPAIAVVSYRSGTWFPLVFAETAVLTVLFACLTFKIGIEGRQKRFIKHAFQRYLSPAVIETLIDDPDQLQLKGIEREISIFFSDIEEFTAISEVLSPEDLTTLLNEYLTAMTRIIMGLGGTVDKFIGDAIVAFWNAPVAVADHADRCVRAALDCQKKLAAMQDEFTVKPHRPLRMRIGVHTGVATVGNLGSEARFDYSILGDAVNLASRLEGANKTFGTYTMISKETLNQLKREIRVRKLGILQVKGRQSTVTVYEPFDKEDYSPIEARMEVFDLGYDAYADGKYQTALVYFNSIAEDDPTAKSYAARCKDLLDKSVQEEIWRLFRK